METTAIHPKTDRIYAESPYTRKLKRMVEDLKVVEENAPELDKAALREVQIVLEHLIGV